jgi:hypothetical protein
MMRSSALQLLLLSVAIYSAAVEVSSPVEGGSTLSSSSPPSPKLVFAHFMMCFAALGPLGNSSESIAGYMGEMAVARANGLDGFAVEWLGHDSYYAPSAQGLYAACEAYNAALPPDAEPFQLFIIINFCCGLNLTDAVNMYRAYYNHSCAQKLDGRPVFSSWSAINWPAGGANESARWQRDFFDVIAAEGLPRPFFLPFIYAWSGEEYEEVATLAEQRQTLAEVSVLDGLWYWGCSPLAPDVASSSAATVQACREVGKVSAVPFSAPYSPHLGDRNSSGGNNRYTQSNGGKAIADTWTSHIATQPDVVIATTWNDLGEHHYVGPYNKTLWGHDTITGWDAGSGPNVYPHTAYLELAAYYIRWYKLPAGSPAPAIQAGDEALFFFYNLQPVNNTCALDPIGPLTKIEDRPEYPLEDAVYVTVLLAAEANVTITTGGGVSTTFELAAGVQTAQVPALAGQQQFEVQRNGIVLALAIGTEAINTTAEAEGICNDQTFSGVLRW